MILAGILGFAAGIALTHAAWQYTHNQIVTVWEGTRSIMNLHIKIAEQRGDVWLERYNQLVTANPTRATDEECDPVN